MENNRNFYKASVLLVTFLLSACLRSRHEESNSQTKDSSSSNIELAFDSLSDLNNPEMCLIPSVPALPFALVEKLEDGEQKLSVRLGPDLGNTEVNYVFFMSTDQSLSGENIPLAAICRLDAVDNNHNGNPDLDEICPTLKSIYEDSPDQSVIDNGCSNSASGPIYGLRRLEPLEWNIDGEASQAPISVKYELKDQSLCGKTVLACMHVCKGCSALPNPTTTPEASNSLRAFKGKTLFVDCPPLPTPTPTQPIICENLSPFTGTVGSAGCHLAGNPLDPSTQCQAYADLESCLERECNGTDEFAGQGKCPIGSGSCVRDFSVNQKYTCSGGSCMRAGKWKCPDVTPTPVPTLSNSPEITPQVTPSPTHTVATSPTATFTADYTATSTPTNSQTATAVPTSTNSSEVTPTPLGSSTPEVLPTTTTTFDMPTSTPTSTSSYVPSWTPTSTSTWSITGTPTFTVTGTVTSESTVTATPTSSPWEPSATPTNSASPHYSVTSTPTVTGTATTQSTITASPTSSPWQPTATPVYSASPNYTPATMPTSSPTYP